MVTITHFNGLQLSTVNIDCGLPYGNDGPFTAQPNLRSRNNQVPIQESIQYGERTLPFIVVPTGSVTDANFRANVYRYLTPLDGLRTIQATHDDGSTTITAQADIISLQKVQNRMYSGTFLLPDPIWRKSTSSNSTSSPTSASGTYKALPSISITPTSSTLQRRRVTITDNATTNRGQMNYPILATFDSTLGAPGATTSADYIVFDNGRAIPFNVTGHNTASTRIWFRVDIPKGGSKTIDIYYGSSINNTSTADTFVDGGMALASSSNTSWVWDDYSVSTFPTATGVWRPGKLGLSLDNTTFGINSESSSGVTFAVENDASLVNDADTMIVTLGSPATANLTGLTRVLTLQDSDGVLRGFVKYRIAGGVSWITASSQSIDSTLFTSFPQSSTNTKTITNNTVANPTVVTANGHGFSNGDIVTITGSNSTPSIDGTHTISNVTTNTFTVPVNVTVSGNSGTVKQASVITNAVEIAIGIEPAEERPRGTYALSGSITVDLSNTPSISVGANSTARLINGTLTNSTNGDVITFTDVYLDNVAMTIDCLNKTITVASGPWYGSITFSDPDDWWALNVGSNTWSYSAGTFTTSITWFDRYLI